MATLFEKELATFITFRKLEDGERVQDVAKKLGVTAFWLYRLRKGESAPSAEFINRLCSVYDQPPAFWHRLAALQNGFEIGVDPKEGVA